MGGLLKSLKQYPFMYRGTAYGDLFGDLEDGYYTINIDSRDVTNSPCGYGILFKLTGGDNYSFMEVHDVLSNVVYHTERNNKTTWRTWRLY